MYNTLRCLMAGARMDESVTGTLNTGLPSISFAQQPLSIILSRLFLENYSSCTSLKCRMHRVTALMAKTNISLELCQSVLTV
ncbi:hypothetical protein Y032_0048g1686 [Ancylostoma ceylanicum]|uniref:Uncharacterized protein n=1 Tax=Ancylostoma ceylanicum TaxID=53326 RepID=A0A016UBN2_9BILA|nr:hypothetical protein Y032_0048g1686 [Ancylostoma ceylanicum]